MAFKMKGPGLPGFRKNAGSGFYKNSGFNIKTSNRSPMKQGEETTKTDEYTEVYDSLMSKERADYSKLSEEEQSKVDWNKKVSQTKQKATDITGGGMEIVDTENVLELGTLSHEVGSSGKSYEQAYESADKTKFPTLEGFKIATDDYNASKKQLIYRESQNINVNKIAPKKDVEYTNYKIAYTPTGGSNKSVKLDNNDRSARFKLSGSEGTMMKGELSRNDIERLVKDGTFKYEIGNDGNGTGNLLMSKDYFENSYTPMLEMYEAGQENYNNWHDEKDNWIASSRKNITAQLEEEFPNNIFSKGGDSPFNKKYENRKKELEAERLKEGVDNSYLTPKGGAVTAYPDFMYGDPNFGMISPGIYNDDEVTYGTGMDAGDLNHISQGPAYYADGTRIAPNQQGVVTGTGHRLGSKHINQQGHRPLDWELGPDGRYILKDDAQTIAHEKWVNMSRDEKQEIINEDMINAEGMKLKPAEDGKGVDRRTTRYDHLLTSKGDYTRELSPMGSEFHHNLNYNDKSQLSKDNVNDPDLAVRTDETDAEYSQEDLDKINKLKNINNQN